MLFQREEPHPEVIVGQVENRVKPRPVKRTPGKGDLPLPQSLESLSLGSLSLEYQPSAVEDLNEVLPEDAQKFVTPKPHPKVRK